MAVMKRQGASGALQPSKAWARASIGMYQKEAIELGHSCLEYRRL